jgi:hypothetical protein
MFTMLVLNFIVSFVTGANALTESSTISRNCRSQPGDTSFPTERELQSFNQSIEGRLVNVVPSAKFCKQRGGCTDAEWANAAFMNTVPGAMFQVSVTFSRLINAQNFNFPYCRSTGNR